MAMKINDRVLCSIATSNSPVDREGWLNKKELNKTFVRRWFVLKGNLLFYYDKKNDKEPSGVIILVGYRVELDEDDKQYTFKIIFHRSQEKPYVLGAENQDSMELWMKAIACAGFDYMKLMVADLQRQIDEIEESSSQSTQEIRRAPPRDRRYNPFDTLEVISQASDDTEGQQSTKKLSFTEVHRKYGGKILQHRKEWLSEKEKKDRLIDI